MNTKRMLMHWLMLTFVILALVLMLLWPVSAPSDDPTGLDAFSRGDYATSHRE